MQRVLFIHFFPTCFFASLYMDLLLHLYLLVYFYVDLQVSTGSRPPSGWYHNNQTSALVPGVGVPLMASWDSSTSSSSSTSKTDPRASAWPAFMQ